MQAPGGGCSSPAKTVETRLYAAYRKLDVDSRPELGQHERTEAAVGG